MKPGASLAWTISLPSERPNFSTAASVAVRPWVGMLLGGALAAAFGLFEKADLVRVGAGERVGAVAAVVVAALSALPA